MDIYIVNNSWGPTEEDNQIPLKKGDEIDVTLKDESGWWWGKNLKSGKEGYFPGSFVSKKKAVVPPPFRGGRQQAKDRQSSFRAALVQTNSNRRSGRKARWTEGKSVARINRVERNEHARLADIRRNKIHQADPALQDPKDEVIIMKVFTGRHQDAEIQSLKVNQNSKTIWCVVGHYQGYIAGVTSIWLGYIGFKWGQKGMGAWTGIRFEEICGVYCFVAGLLTILYEYKWGVKVDNVTMYRVCAYIALAFTPCLSVSTLTASLAYIMTAGTYYLAVYYGESGFKFRKSGKNGGGPSLASFSKWFVDARQQNKWQKYTFALIWILINAYVYMERLNYYNEFVEANPGAVTNWLSHAKANGTILDINMTMILIPVSKNLIRLIYDRSTDQTKMAKCLRWIVFLIPLDKSIQLHKLQATLIFLAAVAHSFSHFVHYAEVPATYGALFGFGVWFTGIILLMVTHWLYSTALDVVRKVKFEIFYYTHHLFVVYYVFTLFHGANFWNPNFWKYLLLPGSIYFFERFLREYKSTRAIGVVSATMMNAKYASGDARVLCLELAKVGPIASYKEGQYVDVKCPMISKFQWHPFTISSAPQKKNVTLHIRDQGPGTWTNRVYNYMLILAGNETRVCPRQRINNQPMSVGPDGRPLFQIAGPHPAPTQHLGEYHVAMVVGGGIGVTPVRATLFSIVHRFKYGLGMSYPDHAYLYWLVRHKDLKTYMFMMRSIKEISDELYDLRHKNEELMKTKSFEFHVCITSNPRSGIGPYERNAEEENADDQSLWGSSDLDPSSENFEVLKVKSGLDEWKIFETLWYTKNKTERLGDFVKVERFYDKDPKDSSKKKQRMDWSPHFQRISEKHRGLNCGVMYCGPAAVANILKVKCGEHTDYSTTRFIFHKENF